MLGKKKVACIIPARLKSTRFPRKMLAQLGSKPLMQWAWEAACSVSLFDTVAFAIDSQEVARVIEDFGGTYFFTEESCQNGTERMIELQKNQKVDADIWVNWQGDEPFITEGMIKNLLQTCACEESDVWTLAKKIDKLEEIATPHIAKVVFDAKGFALYFSRSVIPHYRDAGEVKSYYKHIGLYAFTKQALEKIAMLSPAPLELAEQLEQLRFLYHGLKIRVHETKEEAMGIDLPEHLAAAELFLSKRIC